MSTENVKQRYPHIFQELKIRGKTIRNRTISGPMILEWAMDKNGFLTERGMKAFGAFAKGGTAVITLGEGRIDDLNSMAHAHHFDSRDPDVIEQYHFFTEYVHAYGSLASIEFNHNGPHSLPEFSKDHLEPMGPSDVIMPSGIHVREMTKADMDQVADSYAKAALIAKRSGFDAILLHFAHGWLVGSFLSPMMNKRTDEYGGSYENRMRFPLEIIHRMREVAGEELILEVRLNGSEATEGGIEIEDAIEYAKILDRDGNIDLLHVSQGTRNDGRTRPIKFPSHFTAECHNAKYAEAIKKAGVKIPVGIVGGVTDPDTVEEILASGKADYVVLARQLLADPDWVNKIKYGHVDDIRRCTKCLHCFDSNRTNSIGKAVTEDWQGTKIHLCDINPVFGHGALIGEIPAPKYKKKVVIVGGGPAGLNAAIKACDSGHKVVLYEQSNALGGLLKIYPDPVWFKQGEKRYREYLIHQVEKREIEVHLNTKATPELVKAQNPDTVLIGIGGRANHTVAEVEKGSRAIDVLGIYNHEDTLGKNVVIIGGGTSGCEAALHLSHLGIHSVVIEKINDLALDEPFSSRNHVVRLMEEAENIKIALQREAVRITAEGVYVKNLVTKEEEFYKADTVIYATGMKSKEEEASEFDLTAIDVIKIGDCRKIGTIGTATHDGYNAAATIYGDN